MENNINATKPRKLTKKEKREKQAQEILAEKEFRRKHWIDPQDPDREEKFNAMFEEFREEYEGSEYAGKFYDFYTSGGAWELSDKDFDEMMWYDGYWEFMRSKNLLIGYFKIRMEELIAEYKKKGYKVGRRRELLWEALFSLLLPGGLMGFWALITGMWGFCMALVVPLFLFSMFLCEKARKDLI